MGVARRSVCHGMPVYWNWPAIVRGGAHIGGWAIITAVCLSLGACGWIEIGGGEGPYTAERREIPSFPPPTPKPDVPSKNDVIASLPTTRTPAFRSGTYRVRSGDTIYSIAQAQGIDAYELANANGLLPPFELSEGQVLRLPGKQMELSGGLPVARPGDAPQDTVHSAPSRDEASEQTAALPRQPEPLPSPPKQSGGFIWPVDGKVISEFGSKGDGRFNDGINIAAPEGTPVRAAEAGIVAYAGNELRAFGNMLLIRHADGWVSAYAHNQELLVHRGERVRRGQIIARVGSTGNVGEPQLHFELRRGKRPVNPLTQLGRASADGDAKSSHARWERLGLKDVIGRG